MWYVDKSGKGQRRGCLSFEGGKKGRQLRNGHCQAEQGEDKLSGPHEQDGSRTDRRTDGRWSSRKRQLRQLMQSGSLKRVGIWGAGRGGVSVLTPAALLLPWGKDQDMGRLPPGGGRKEPESAPVFKRGLSPSCLGGGRGRDTGLSCSRLVVKPGGLKGEELVRYEKKVQETHLLSWTCQAVL